MYLFQKIILLIFFSTVVLCILQLSDKWKIVVKLLFLKVLTKYFKTNPFYEFS